MEPFWNPFPSADAMPGEGTAELATPAIFVWEQHKPTIQTFVFKVTLPQGVIGVH
jgi:hypothetical protein